VFHRPRGENHGPEDRASELVGNPQPRHACAVGQSDVLGRVDLPGLVRPRRPQPLDRLGLAAWGCRPQAGLGEPTLKRADIRCGLDPLPLEHDPDEAGAPGGMLLAHQQGGCPCRVSRFLARGRAGPIRREFFGTPLSSSLQDASHRASGQTERLSHFGGRGALLMALPERLPDRQRDRARHDWTSLMRHPRFVSDSRIMPKRAARRKTLSEFAADHDVA
jgi:hypothetical protein